MVASNSERARKAIATGRPVRMRPRRPRPGGLVPECDYFTPETAEEYLRAKQVEHAARRHAEQVKRLAADRAAKGRPLPHRRPVAAIVPPDGGPPSPLVAKAAERYRSVWADILEEEA